MFAYAPLLSSTCTKLKMSVGWLVGGDLLLVFSSLDNPWGMESANLSSVWRFPFSLPINSLFRVWGILGLTIRFQSCLAAELHCSSLWVLQVISYCSWGQEVLMSVRAISVPPSPMHSIMSCRVREEGNSKTSQSLDKPSQSNTIF